MISGGGPDRRLLLLLLLLLPSIIALCSTLKTPYVVYGIYRSWRRRRRCCCFRIFESVIIVSWESLQRCEEEKALARAYLLGSGWQLALTQERGARENIKIKYHVSLSVCPDERMYTYPGSAQDWDLRDWNWNTPSLLKIKVYRVLKCRMVKHSNTRPYLFLWSSRNWVDLLLYENKPTD